MYRLFYGLRYHTDRNRLRKIAEPTPNPTALAAQPTAK